MDKQLRKELEHCLRELDASGDIEACLRLYPDRAEELRPYLETARSLNSITWANPPAADEQRTRQRLLSSISNLAQQKRGVTDMTFLGQRLLPVAAAVLAAVFLLGGLTGASALPGSPVPPPQDALPFFQGDGDTEDALEAQHEAELEALEAECEAREAALEAEHEAAQEAIEGTDQEEEAVEAQHQATEEALDAECHAAEEALEAQHEAEEEAQEAAEEAADEAADAEEDEADAEEDDDESDDEEHIGTEDEDEDEG